MAIQLKALGVDTTDPRRLAGFWAAAVGWDVHDGTAGEVELVPTDGTRFRIVFRPAVLEEKRVKNRLHLDLTTTSSEDQTQSVERLLGLGAHHVDIGQRPDETHVVLADLEGNEFCVIAPDNAFLAGCGRLGSITCDGTPANGSFWSKALGWPLVWDQDEETAIRAPDGTGPFITWGPPVHPKVARNRLHLDLAAPSMDELPAEIDRLVALGARRADIGSDDGEQVVLLDPDGNEFWVLTPG